MSSNSAISASSTNFGIDSTLICSRSYTRLNLFSGYGNFAPVTPEGKVATIIYGTVGIPLCLILLADLGNLIAKIVKNGVKKVKKQLYAGT